MTGTAPPPRRPYLVRRAPMPRPRAVLQRSCGGRSRPSSNRGAPLHLSLSGDATSSTQRLNPSSSPAAGLAVRGGRTSSPSPLFPTPAGSARGGGRGARASFPGGPPSRGGGGSSDLEYGGAERLGTAAGRRQGGPRTRGWRKTASVLEVKETGGIRWVTGSVQYAAAAVFPLNRYSSRGCSTPVRTVLEMLSQACKLRRVISPS